MQNPRPSRRTLRLILPAAAFAALALHTSLIAEETAEAPVPALESELKSVRKPTQETAPESTSNPAPETAPQAVTETAPAAQPEADKAWQELSAEQARPVPPSTWSRETPPKEEELQQWRKSEGERLSKLAEQAADFQKRFPEHQQVETAKRKENQALKSAADLGNETAAAKLDANDKVQLESGNLSDDDRFKIRASQIQRQAMKQSTRDAAAAEFAKGARELVKEFPKRPEPYMMLVQVSEALPEEEKLKVLKEIAAGDAPEQAKEAAQASLKRADALGKPVDIKFTSIDGKEIDLQSMKGKVVLVDFWATWCGPCVAEIPNVKAAYEKLHPKGFEIIGISFDQDKSKLESFVKEKDLKWPQYFDGAGWQNKFGQEFGIRSIPTMWLVDKQGNLKDMNARQNLEEKVTKLLEE